VAEHSVVECRARQAENRPSEEEKKDDLKLKFALDNYVGWNISLMASEMPICKGKVVDKTVMELGLADLHRYIAIQLTRYLQ